MGSANSLSQPALSDDGRTIGVQRFDPGTQRLDLWSIRTDRDLEERLTSQGIINGMPVWSPDGSRLVFMSARASPPNLFLKDVTSGSEQRLFESTMVTHPTDWTRDGRFVVYAALNFRTGWDVMYLPMTVPEAERRPQPLMATPFNEHFGRVSPDGGWLAYMSDELGVPEVFVQRFPGLGAKHRVSTSGGSEPQWRSDGGELFYLAPGDVLMSVSVSPGDPIRLSAPVAVFKTAIGRRNARVIPFEPTYAIGRDGRLLINTVTEEASSMPSTIVFNWPALVTAPARNPAAR
jgi:Tol biopolymer transport system component